MSIWTFIALSACAVILILVLYLNLRCDYRSGPARTAGFFAMAIGAAVPLYEVTIADREYEILPSTAMALLGTAIFMVSHWLSFETKSQQKKGVEDGKNS